ncbi:MAG: di-heme oxidoredictase family protein [Planctomycetota bacterium]
MLRLLTYGCAIALVCVATGVEGGGGFGDRPVAVDESTAPTPPLNPNLEATPPADAGDTAAEPEASAGLSAATVEAAPLDIHAFEKLLPTLEAARNESVTRGRDLFEVSWLPGPSPGEKDGLGPLLNARACNECHLRAGRGRARGPQWGGLPGLVLRIGVRSPLGEDGAHRADRPHPRYGRQIQDRSLAGVRREAGVSVRWSDHRVVFPDGTERTLKRPSFTPAGSAYGTFEATGEDSAPFEVTSGARLAPALVGLGLLEAIPDAAIIASADPDDRDGDGVSGRVAFLNGGTDGPVGRFGWKATHITLESQIAEAFAEDVGITSDLYPAESFPAAQHRVLAMASGGTPELSEEELNDTANFIRALAVPLPPTPQTQRGRTLFETVGCAKCHTPQWRTAHDHPWPELRNLEIQPYTDLLLHDLGPDLADGKRDGVAQPNEWRTPPLWGLGRHPVINGNTHLLHDGRARTIEEAILWHGGEAANSRTAYMALKKEERAALMEFLEGL